MRGHEPIPGPSQAAETRAARGATAEPMRRAARLVARLGAVAVGLYLVSSAPKDVVLVYDLAGAPDATALEIELRRGDELVRRAEFPAAAGGRQIRHAVRLPQGQYALSWRAAGPSGSRTGARVVDVEEEGTIVLPVGR